jgi:predicted alpha/beta-hydrolase family hydrolase
MPDRFDVAVAPSQHITAMNYPAATGNRAGVTLILGHGAGADQTSGFMVAFANALAERGIDIVTFNFLYTELRRRIPDPNARLESCWRAVIEIVRSLITTHAGRLAIGGKSMGGRIASQVAADDAGDLAGLVFLGYPLHAPGRPDRLRSAHLQDVKAPMLFVQGSRDAFGTPAELRPIISQFEPVADLFVVEGGDHSFKIPKSAGVTQQDVYRAIQDRIETWLRIIASSRG